MSPSLVHMRLVFAKLAFRISLLMALGPTCWPQVQAFQVQIMITSKLTSLDRRMVLRESFSHCSRHSYGQHSVEHHFFLADSDGAPEEVASSLLAEESQFGDLIFVGGPDSDPFVNRDVTYVLDRPTARGYRLAYGTAWLAQHRPDLDFVMYLDDDSYLNVPRLLQRLEQHPTHSLAMGYTMETPLDMSKMSICDLCNPCEWCLKDEALKAFCEPFPGLSLGGCMMLLQQCRLFNDEDDPTDCIRKGHADTLKVSSYFGSLSAPRWFLGMGWVFGRRIVNFLARNLDDLKKQGAADVQLGFWLAPLEGIHWEDMAGGFFHDYPMPGSTFSSGCSDRTILVHRMNDERWKDFDVETCELHCPATAIG
ncbi:unnamed protein product [Polarella glacialis]|uniref:Hexosyltransferase n=2 Tax=Polarella glacialis TaxID=89957 RepID=A0A813FDU3_POLGL|nr:unnamed protein product [Polarella glacialis]CAE8612372.1 unnamed protein product [Polarella glacialis]CAE8645601.1 unnamed protein product [Polarella glacialis]